MTLCIELIVSLSDRDWNDPGPTSEAGIRQDRRLREELADIGETLLEWNFL